jgi:hypothetical protein
MLSLSERLCSVPCVEPEQRLVAGVRGFAVHRFPIRGGITMVEAWRIKLCEDWSRPNFFPKRHWAMAKHKQMR